MFYKGKEVKWEFVKSEFDEHIYTCGDFRYYGYGKKPENALDAYFMSKSEALSTIESCFMYAKTPIHGWKTCYGKYSARHFVDGNDTDKDYNLLIPVLVDVDIPVGSLQYHDRYHLTSINNDKWRADKYEIGTPASLYYSLYVLDAIYHPKERESIVCKCCILPASANYDTAYVMITNRIKFNPQKRTATFVYYKDKNVKHEFKIHDTTSVPEVVYSLHDTNISYKPGDKGEIDDFDTNPKQCSRGFHFCTTPQAALNISYFYSTPGFI